MLGPAVQRLEMRFPSRQAYTEYWQAHPALRDWNAAIQSYVDYDLTGLEPSLRSKVNADAVAADSLDLLEGGSPEDAWTRLRHDAVFLRAERGLLDQPVPLYPDPTPIAQRMPVRTLPGTNHYTILLAEAGAAAGGRGRTIRPALLM